MTPERWQQIRDVLEKALDLAPAERSAFLNQACRSDPSLRQEVETLLASSDPVRSSFLQSSPTRIPLTSGTKLGDYEVKSLLGAGGMGEVYRARDARLGRDVAIKVLPSLLSADSERLRRFEQEARAAAALNHPNILAVYQMGTYEGAPYLVTELLEGETLREQIRRGRLSVRKAIDHGVQIARGLAAAHEKGIVHRDLKPENLFVTRDGRVKILDFGLAKLTQPQPGSEHDAPTLTEQTEAGVVMGTVGYMAPEQVRGQPADHRADIFAFGAILYEMLAGKRAFQKPTSPETMSAILNEDPPGISQVAANIPPAMQRVVHRCLEKNPEQRFQSASDMAFALDALSEGSGHRSTAEITKAPIPLWRTAWMVGIGLVVILAGVALWRRWGAKTNERSGELVRRQLTSNPPGEPILGAAISRDGKYLAYASALAKRTHILEIDSGELRDLPSPDAPTPFDWFPDGSHLLVQRIGHPGLWKVSIWDGTYRKLLEDDRVSSPSVSPDGSHVAFRRGPREIWLMGADGEEPHRILAPEMQYTVGSIAWSPHGHRLLYDRSLGEYGKPEVTIETCDLTGSRRTVVLSAPRLWGPAGLSPLSWLPDGRILYDIVQQPSATYNVWAIAADLETGERLGQPKALTTWERDMPEIFSTSADGKRLIYDSHRDRDVMFLADLRSANKKPSIRRLTVDDWHSYPTDWDRDSGAVVFDSFRDGRWVILKQSISGQAPEVLVPGAGNYNSPTLSPDGERMLFTERANISDAPRRVMTMPSAGGGRSLLLEGKYSYHCSYLLSAGCVLGEIQGQQLVLSFLDPVKGKGAEIQRLDVNPSADWSLSPDGTRIAIGDYLQWIRILTIADHKLVPVPHTGNWESVQHVTWAADGNHLFATAWSDSTYAFQALLLIDPLGNVQPIDEVSQGTAWIMDMRASPDGHYLAYTKRIYEANVTMLENF